MNFTYASNLRTFLSKRILSIFTILFQRNSIAKKKTGKPRKLSALREMIVHHMDGLQIQYFGLVEYSPTTINQKKSINAQKIINPMKTNRRTKLLYQITLSMMLVFLGQNLFGQVKIGDNTENINPYAILELESDRLGVIWPSMSTEQRDAAFINDIPIGLTIYNTDERCIQYWDQQWRCTSTVADNNYGSANALGIAAGGAIVEIKNNSGTLEYTLLTPYFGGLTALNNTDDSIKKWDGSTWVNGLYSSGSVGFSTIIGETKTILYNFSGNSSLQTITKGDGSEWAFMNGATITNAQTLYPDFYNLIQSVASSYISGSNVTLIDSRGLFARSANAGRGTTYDPNTTNIWEFSADKTAVNGLSSSSNSAGYHSHSGTINTTGNHAHSYVDESANGTEPAGSGSGKTVGNSDEQHESKATGNGGNHYHSLNINNAGSHSHSISISGDSETKPHNFGVGHRIIRIK